MSWLVGALQPIDDILLLGIAVWLLVRHLEPREGWRPRLAALGGVLLASVLFFSWLGMSRFQMLTVNGTPQLIGQFFAFTTLYAFAAVAVWLLFDTSFAHASFCATAGYTIQNLATGANGLLVLLAGRLLGIPDGDVIMRMLTGNISAALVYTLIYLLFIRTIEHTGITEVSDRRTSSLFVVVILVVILFDVLNKALSYGPTPLAILVLLRAVHGMACLFILAALYVMLFARTLELDKAATEHMLAEATRQYELSRENIEAINIKCHDIRHQIRHLGKSGAAVPEGVLADIAREVSVYDSQVRTGNDALDTILTEKSLVCEAEGITLTCIADGHALDFAAQPDIYALFGNALDNAIEAVRKIPDGNGRSISLVVRPVGEMVSIHVENSCAAEDARAEGSVDRGALEDSPTAAGTTADGADVFGSGPLQTTKLDASGRPDTANHGFGTLSMKRIAERYDGLFSAGRHGDVFSLDITLPRP